MKINYNSFRLLVTVLLGLLWGGGQSVIGQVGVTVTLDPTTPQNVIPADFAGLSFELPTIVPNKVGKYYYDPNNLSLVTLFKTMGIKSLRFGGTSSDGNNYKVSHADIDNLFAFAQSVGAKVIYTLRLENYPPQSKAAQYAAEAPDAQYILSKYASLLDCFCLGNEPNVYYSYGNYAPDWDQFTNVIKSLSPQAVFCGPSSWNSTEGSWTLPFAKQFGKSGKVAFITEHIYQSQSEKFKGNPQGAILEMLAKSDYSSYYNAFVPTLLSEGLEYRLEETNSFSGGGVPEASNTYAATLWGLNYQWWWAQHQAKGLNFHTGYHSANIGNASSYSAFSSNPDGTQTAWGLAYGLLAFKTASQGQFIDTSVQKGANINATTYAILGSDGNIYATVINQESGALGHTATVTLNLASPYTLNQVQTMSLTQTQSDVSFLPGSGTAGSISLGNSSIGANGRWSGGWTSVSTPSPGTGLQVTVPPASAVLVKIAYSNNKAVSTWMDQDIGPVGVAGNGTYDQASGTFKILGSGVEIYGKEDSFHYIYQEVKGSFTIIARLASLQSANKAGIMIRETTGSQSKFVDLAIHPDTVAKLQARMSTGGDASTNWQGMNQSVPIWLKLVRLNDTVTAFVAPSEGDWKQVGTPFVLPMSENVTVGLIESSYNNSALGISTFDHVSILPTGAWASQDIGNNSIAGETNYSDGTFDLTASGEDIWNTSDDFNYVYQALSKNGSITARVSSLGGVNPWSKAGVMVRETLDANSANVALVVSASEGISFQWRPVAGASSSYHGAGMFRAPYWVRLTRNGNTVTGSYSADGKVWSSVPALSYTFKSLADQVYIGLAVTSHNVKQSVSATIDNVTAPQP